MITNKECELRLEKQIYTIRGQRVMLDSDLAALYQVKTKELNLAVKRNPERFPEEFMFQITLEEQESLRFQFETSKKMGRGGRRYQPHVFTEHGVAMLSGVLHSPRAVQVNIVIIKTFIRLKQVVGGNYKIVRRLDDLEKKSAGQDLKINKVFQAIRELVAPSGSPKRKIGIRRED